MSSNSRSTARNKVNNDPVDELKRRSRRRLVGSIALFLAAVLVVPALVENEPSHTQSDVELVVPERPSAEAAQVEQNTESKVAQQSVLDAPKTAQDAAVAAAPVAPAVEPPPLVVAPKAPVKPEPKVEPKAPSKPEPKAPSSPEPKPVAEDPIAAFAKAEVFWVQVAAVSDRSRADALSKELSSKGFPAKVKSGSSSTGTIHRVRVGPISGQAKADETKAKLSAAGYAAGRVVQ